MTFTVANPTPHPVYANVEGVTYELLAGGRVSVNSERTAMLLGEYGLIVNRAQVDEALRVNADFKVEPLVSPMSDHGPGTDERGHTVDEAVAEAAAEAVQQDTAKTPAALAVMTATPAPVFDPGTPGSVSSGDSSDAPSGEPQELKGEALDDALRAKGLPVSGTVAEKRARLTAAPQQ